MTFTVIIYYLRYLEWIYSWLYPTEFIVLDHLSIAMTPIDNVPMEDATEEAPNEPQS